MNNGLAFYELRDANLKRQEEMCDKGVDYGRDWTAAQWFQALGGETGEYANFRKKYERGDLTYEEFIVNARKELADVMCYLDLLCAHLEIDLDDAVIEKFNEISERVGSDVRL